MVTVKMATVPLMLWVNAVIYWLNAQAVLWTKGFESKISMWIQTKLILDKSYFKYQVVYLTLTVKLCILLWLSSFALLWHILDYFLKSVYECDRKSILHSCISCKKYGDCYLVVNLFAFFLNTVHNIQYSFNWPLRYWESAIITSQVDKVEGDVKEWISCMENNWRVWYRLYTVQFMYC